MVGAASGVIATVISASNIRLAAANQTIQQKNEEITRQNEALEKTNLSLAVARSEAEAQRDQAQEITEFLVSSSRKPDPAQDGRTLTVAAVLGGAVKELEARPKLAPVARAAILKAVGETYHNLGFVPETVQVYEKLLILNRQHLGESDPATLSAMSELAVACRDAGQLGRAHSLLDQALSMQRTKLGDDHRDTLTTINNLAIACEGLGQRDRALQLKERAYQGRRARLGEEHLDTLTSMNDLAIAYE
jgi:tetratricopeptide (TPR) repeat protein